MSEADRTAEILGSHLDGNFTVLPMAATPTGEATIRLVGAQLGVSLPAEYIAHLSGRFPGIYVEAKERVWPRPKAYSVGPFWSFLYGLHTYTCDADSQAWMRLNDAADEFRLATGLPVIPCLKIIGDADLYCIVADGSLARFDHELGSLDPVDGTFWDVLEVEVRELAERLLRKMTASGR